MPVPHKPTTSESVVDAILCLIGDSKLAIGDVIPPERELCWRKAPRTMSVISSRQGSGTRIIPPSSRLLESRRVWVYPADPEAAGQSIEARMRRDAEAAQHSARRRSTADTRHLGAVPERMRSSVDSAEDFSAADIGSDEAVASLACYRVLVRRNTQRPRAAVNAVHGHEPVLEAIVAERPELARRAMPNHLSDQLETLSALNGIPVSEPEI